MNNETELLSCPFCGSEADLESGESHYDNVMEYQCYFAAVYCRNQLTCGARIAQILNDEKTARGNVTNQWNHRVQGSGGKE